MYDFVLQIAFMGSLATVAVIFARALPRIEPEEGESPTLFDFIERAARRVPLAQLDNQAHSFAFKALKRTRVIMMKIDNRIMKLLERMKRYGERQEMSSPVQQLLDSVQEKKKDEEETDRTRPGGL